MSNDRKALAAAVRARVSGLLGDGVHSGAVVSTAVDMVAELAAMGGVSPIEAVVMGRIQERADILAFLAGRRTAALTIADKHPEMGEGADTHARAKWAAEQIAIEIEAFEQGLHEGRAAQ
ncbi:hypothetical protein Saro_0638 [Novosphingobium aromaticivorans DSM 12444]|uniref:Uncharacterized protein n=1 Tax=Novosphingobium aromaticivorans (strain ATCC 700278 / DSM 12444 / CCUG 56034 / CIP 105152 / NBRC 16084 / F199) TaxID=279238 RepID=Q2GAN8_NOVAD|nr:hypothetical protein [Novosphingobium aromaticivorans]ABD25085.1 hypothetical protein Saro_0638 [Novosphingobium aromaticivorans DSM 12444]SCY96031.1 hypothetical protein SAMN05660666_03897 [Novosphingobium aromaticivorans]